MNADDLPPGLPRRRPAFDHRVGVAARFLDLHHQPGLLDAAFGSGGKATVDFNNGDTCAAIALQADGKIVMGGIGNRVGSDDFGLARFNANGSLDLSFGDGGKVTTFFFPYDYLSFIQDVAIQPDGKIVAGGYLYKGGSDFDIAVVRYEGGCTPRITPTSQSFSASGGAGSIGVFDPSNCGWAVVKNNPEFITVTSGPGSGNGTVTYAVAAHSATGPRSGTVTVAGRTFTVYQGARYHDVAPGHPFYAEIGKLSGRGVTLGCGGGNYCPDQVVTREQVAAFIMRARGEYNPGPPPLQRFADVPPENPLLRLHRPAGGVTHYLRGRG